MEPFEFELEESWGAAERVLTASTGEQCTLPRTQAKERLIALLGPTGRVVAPVMYVQPELFVTQSVITQIYSAIYNYIVTVPPEKFSGVSRTGLYDWLYNSLLSVGPVAIATNRLQESHPVGERKVRAGTKVTTFLKVRGAQEGLSDEAMCFALEAYSVGLSVFKPPKKSHLVLSANPLDILMASECTTGWGSCHSLSGTVRTGPLSYMYDSVTLIAYAYTSCLEYLDNLVLPRKIWRQMVFVDLDRLSAICSREYPQDMPHYAQGIRALVAGVLARHAGVEQRWKWRRLRGMTHSTHDAMVEESAETFSCTRAGGWTYPDTPTARVRLVDGAEPHLGVGVASIPCPFCGSPRTDDDNRDRFECPGCFGEEQVACCHCGSIIDEEDARSDEAGDTYCENCYSDLYTVCDSCGHELYRQDAVLVEGDYVCESCAQDAVRCELCGEFVWLDDAYAYGTEGDDGSVCSSCVRAWNLVQCADCGSYVHANDVHTVAGEDYCEACAPEKEEEVDVDAAAVPA